MDKAGGLNRLRWRSRRGLLELDLLLLPFYDEMYSELEADQQQTFVDMLEEDDPDLLMWFSRKAVPENKQMAALVEIILNRVQP